MYNYIDLKKKENNKKNGFFFKKWKKQNLENFENEDIIWLSDTGETYYKECELTTTTFNIKNTYFDLQTSNSLEIENIIKKLNKKDCSYYKISTPDMCFFIRIKNNDIINENENPDFLMFNIYNYMYELNIISNTKYNEERYSLVVIKNKIKQKKVFYLNKDIVNLKINKIPDQLIQINWVWFRKNNKKLTSEITERATSWIIINPNSKFHLWTNLKDNDEWNEFISEIKDEIKELFIKNIIVHYYDETMNLVLKVMEEYKNSKYYDEESYKLLYNEFTSVYKNALIFKTDIIRLMILYEYGGVYADFNDCLCLSPIKNIFAIHNIKKPLGVSDNNDLNHASNYFLYSPRQSEEWKNIMFEMMHDSKYIVCFLKNIEMKNETKKFCLDLILQMCENDFYVENDENKYDKINKINTIYEDIFNKLPYLGNTPRPITTYYWKIFIYSIIHNILDDENSKETVKKLLTELKNKKTKQKEQKEKTNKYSKINFNIDNYDIKFDKEYDYWWTDYNLNAIMHYTNFPIYCRMKKYELYLLPYGYYYNYSCLLSWVGHLGDGGSYGSEASKNKFTARKIYEE
jgi:hypothetical protein